MKLRSITNKNVAALTLDISNRTKKDANKYLTSKNDNILYKNQEQWIRVLIDEIFMNRMRHGILNTSLNEMFGQTVNDIRFKIEMTIMNVIKCSQKNPDKFIYINLTPLDKLLRVHVKLMYIPNLINIIHKSENKPFAKSGLVWGIVGNDLIHHHGSLPAISNVSGKTILPLYHSNQEVWYPFHEYKFRMMQIVLELSLLHKYLSDNSLLRVATLANKTKTTKRGLLGLIDTDIQPDLRFVNDFDDKFQTILVDHIKGNPIKGLKPYKTITYSENGTITIYQFNLDQQFKLSQKIISDGIARAARQIPILYNRRLIWSTKLNHVKSSNKAFNKASLMMKNELIQFQKSKCIVTILSFSRYTRILIKSSSYNKMYIVDPWKKFNNYEQNTLYQKIVNVAKSIGLTFVFLDTSFEMKRELVKIEGSSILAALARAINICMHLMLDNDNKLMYDDEKLIEHINEQINDSVALITISVMKKDKKVTFNPIIEYFDSL